MELVEISTNQQLSENEILNNNRNYVKRNKVLLMCLNASLGCCFWGYTQSVYGGLVEINKQIFEWNEDQSNVNSGLLSSIIQLFAIIGVVITGYISDTINKRKAFIILDIFCIIGTLIVTFSHDFDIILAGRSIQGIGIGSNAMLVQSYINEISPVNMRGMTGVFLSAQIMTGQLLVAIFSFFLPLKQDTQNYSKSYYEFILSFPIYICLFRIVNFSFYFTHDSIRYLIQQNKSIEAQEMLSNIYENQFVEQELKILEQNYSYQSIISWKYLLTTYKKRILIGIILGFLMQISGIIPVLIYSDRIFEGDENTARIFSIFLMLVFLLSNIIASFYCEQFGRKSLLILGTFLLIIINILISVTSYYQIASIQKYLILLFAFSFCLSLGPIVWLYISEILPTKASTICQCNIFFWAAIISDLFPLMAQKLELSGCFILFTGFLTMGIFFIFYIVKETKGKTYQQIETLYQNQ